jgi:hypothetical protein
MTSFEYDAMVRGCGIITPKEEAANCGAALAKLKPQFVTGVTPDLPPLTPGEVAAIGAGCAAMSVYAPNDRCVSGHRKLKAIILKGKLGAVVSGQQ